jgi:flagellar biosynthesis GTPase FlhF
MSVTASSMPPNENQEIIDFLRRLASMLTGGRNAEMLQQAASIIETLAHRAITAEQLCLNEQEEHARSREAREAADRSAETLRAEIVSMTAQLAETTRQAESERTFFAEETRRLQARVQDADAELAKARAELAETSAELAKASAELAKTSAELEELRKPVMGIDDTIAIVPVDSLQLARTQFDFLAAGFAKTGDVISQTICQIGACAIDKALADNEPASKA